MAIVLSELIGQPYPLPAQARSGFTQASDAHAVDVVHAVDVTEECRSQIGWSIHGDPNRRILLLYTHGHGTTLVYIIVRHVGDPPRQESYSFTRVREFRDQLSWFDIHADSVKAKLRPLCMPNEKAVSLIEQHAPR